MAKIVIRVSPPYGIKKNLPIHIRLHFLGLTSVDLHSALLVCKTWSQTILNDTYLYDNLPLYRCATCLKIATRSNTNKLECWYHLQPSKISTCYRLHSQAYGYGCCRSWFGDAEFKRGCCLSRHQRRVKPYVDELDTFRLVLIFSVPPESTPQSVLRVHLKPIWAYVEEIVNETELGGGRWKVELDLRDKIAWVQVKSWIKWESPNNFLGPNASWEFFGFI